MQVSRIFWCPDRVDLKLTNAQPSDGNQIYKLSDVLFYLFQSTISSTPSQSPAGKTLRFLQLLPYNWVSSFVSLDNHYLLKWLWWDAVLVVGVAWLRIPGLRYGVGRMVIYLSFLYLIDTVLMGKFHVSEPAAPHRDSG
jgi:hypothetical protein